MDPKWVVIYIAHSDESAEAIRELVSREGFLCRINPFSRSASSGESCYEVMTLKAEAQEARDMLQEHGF